MGYTQLAGHQLIMAGRATKRGATKRLMGDRNSSRWSCWLSALTWVIVIRGYAWLWLQPFTTDFLGNYGALGPGLSGKPNVKTTEYVSMHLNEIVFVVHYSPCIRLAQE